MAKREAKPVQVWPVNPTGPFQAIRWVNKGDWVALCRLAGWSVGDTSDPPEYLEDSEGDEVGPGDWLVKLPSGSVGMSDMEFRSRYIVEKKHGKA